jgi:hypothetical protein
VGVSTNASGVVTSVNSVITPGSYSTPPTNPAGTTGGAGSGLTLNIPWAMEAGCDTFYPSATNLTFSLECTFTDDSSKIPYDGSGNFTAGNHGHYEAKLQQLQLDSQGNPMPAQGGGWLWTEFDAVGNPLPAQAGAATPGVAVVADLYGPGATVDMQGNPLTGGNQAQANQSVSATIAIPARMTQVNNILRVAIRFYLGDTRSMDGQGPLSSVEIDGTNPQVTQVPLAYDWSFIRSPFQVAILPSNFIQLNAIPMGLIYAPPGSKSTESFSYLTSYQTSLTMSDAQENTYSVANQTGTSIEFQQGTDGSLGASFLGIKLGLDLTQSTQTTSSWDTTTTAGVDQSLEDDTTITVGCSEQVTYGPLSGPGLAGETASPDEEPYRSDTMLLIVCPQFAVWNYPNLHAMQFLSSWPGYFHVAISDLYAVAFGPASGFYTLTNQGSTPASTVNLSQAECLNLVNLDPFWVALWQGAALSGSQWHLIGSEMFGTEIFVTAISGGSQTAVTAASPSGQNVLQVASAASFCYGQFAVINYGQATQEIAWIGPLQSGGAPSLTMLSPLVNTHNMGETVIAGPQTSVKSLLLAGNIVLQVGSTTGFSSGQSVVINYGQPTMESATIESVQQDLSLTMKAPLINKHNAGETVFGNLSPELNHLPVQLQFIDTTDYNQTQVITAKYTAQTQNKFTMEQNISNGVKYSLSYQSPSPSSGESSGGGGSSGGTSGSVGLSGSYTVTDGSMASATSTYALAVTYQTKQSMDYKTVTTITGSLDDQPPQTTVKGSSPAGQTVLQVASTVGFTAGMTVVINLVSNQIAPTTEVTTIRSVQAGSSLTMLAPLANTHSSSEAVQPFWWQMTVNAYRDLAFGGIAFQDLNAQKP